MYFNKKPSLDFKKLEKMSAMDPKVVLLNSIDLFSQFCPTKPPMLFAVPSCLRNAVLVIHLAVQVKGIQVFSQKACRNSRHCSPTPMKNPSYTSPSLLFPTCHILSSKLQGTCSTPPSSLQLFWLQCIFSFPHYGTQLKFIVIMDQYQCLGDCPPTPPLTQH